MIACIGTAIDGHGYTADDTGTLEITLSRWKRVWLTLGLWIGRGRRVEEGVPTCRSAQFE